MKTHSKSSPSHASFDQGPNAKPLTARETTGINASAQPGVDWFVNAGNLPTPQGNEHAPNHAGDAVSHVTASQNGVYAQ